MNLYPLSAVVRGLPGDFLEGISTLPDTDGTKPGGNYSILPEGWGKRNGLPDAYSAFFYAAVGDPGDSTETGAYVILLDRDGYHLAYYGRPTRTLREARRLASFLDADLSPADLSLLGFSYTEI